MIRLAELTPATPDAGSRFGLLVSQLHTAVDLDAFWKASLQLLSEFIPHHSFSLMYGIVDLTTLNARHHIPGARLDRRSVSNLFIARSFLERHSSIKFYTFDDVLAEDPSAHEKRLAQQGASVDPWTNFAHLVFWEESRPDAVLSIRRGATHGPFNEQEKAWLQNMHPIIEAGLERLRRLTEERSQRFSIERFLSDVAVPVLFLDSQLRLIYASREGYEVCAEWNFGERTARGLNPRRSFKLPEAMLRACVALASQPHAMEKGERKCQLTHGTNPRLSAQIVIEGPRSSQWARPVYRVVFLLDPTNEEPPRTAKPSAQALLQRLTPIERRVAVLVTEGHDNRSIGQRLSKSSRTVESQLTEIYRKLGTKNRVQLTRVLI